MALICSRTLDIINFITREIVTDRQCSKFLRGRNLLLALCCVGGVCAFPPSHAAGSDDVYAGWHKQYNDSLKGANVVGLNQYIFSRHLKSRKPVVVGVIDSGIDTSCVSVTKALWTNPKEKPNGRDDDRNGYVDDLHGWNFLGTRDGSFNMVSAGTEEYREFKRLYPKYKHVRDTSGVAPADRAEYAYYTVMRRKAKINSYLMFYQISVQKQQSLASVDSIVKAMPAVAADTLTLRGLIALPVSDSRWDSLLQAMTTDLYRTPLTTKWTDYLSRQRADHRLMERRIWGIEHDKDKRLLMGDDMNNAADRHYGNNTLTVDGCDHGTFVASVIAGQPADMRYAGIFPEARIMVVRVSPNGDEYDKDVASGIYYAVDNGASVINLSLGKYTSPQARMVNDAIAYAARHDVLIVAAAGNNALNIDSTAYFPSAVDSLGNPFPNYIRVGASTPAGTRSSLSNYGLHKVDIYAPGELVAGVFPGDELSLQQGTSVAAPVVTAIAAMMRAYYPKAKAAQIKEALVATARRLNGIALVDAEAAFRQLAGRR